MKEELGKQKGDRTQPRQRQKKKKTKNFLNYRPRGYQYSVQLYAVELFVGKKEEGKKKHL